VSGVTLFTAVQVSLTMRPAAPGQSGIVFRRVDLPGSPTVAADHTHVISEQRRTVLQGTSPGPGPVARVETVEHVLSALAGMGITDALVDLDGPEVPIGDGSAEPFTDAIAAAGTAALDHQCAQAVRVEREMLVEDRLAQVRLLPASGEGLELEYRLDYGPDSPIPAQAASLVLLPGGDARNYIAEVAPARTFCLAAEAQAMRKMGLFGHLEPRDLLVIGEHGPIENAYRFPDEPARHKLLDLLGDLALAGRPINARVVATRSGHTLNHAAARALASLVT
jgi:UDP-3-O-acyl N-acetylglucosamine deacetylase